MSSNNEFVADENPSERNQRVAEGLHSEIQGFQTIPSDNEIGTNFNDVFTTIEQKRRDVEITKLLKCYVSNYSEKSISNCRYKNIIFYMCIFILICFSLAFLKLLYANVKLESVNHNNIIQLVTVCITYLTLVIGLLKIITRYVFSEKEEEYIARIVESIQRNDLENKEANMKSSERNT